MELGGHGKLARLKEGGGAKQLDARAVAMGRCIVYFLLGLVMACSRVMDGGAPFGMAMVACAGPGISGVLALAGASLGYLVSGGIEWGIRYIAAAVLSYTVAFVFHELSIYKQSFFMPSAAAAVMALTGFLGNLSLASGDSSVVAELTLEVSLAFGGTYFFREALTGKLRTTESDELKHNVSIMIMIACALMSFSRITLFELVSLGRIIALVVVMTSAMKGGILTGAAGGTLLGLAMDIASAGPPYYTMAYSFSGLLSGVFSRHGRVLFTLSFILSGALSVVCAWSSASYLGILFETFCAAVIFMLLPASLLNHVGLILQSMEKGNGESGLRRFVAGKVKNLGSAYTELYEIVLKSMAEPSNDENIAKIYDRAADAVCVKCRNKNKCWNSDYIDTLSAMNDATQAMSEHGALSVDDLPGFFRERCGELSAFVAAVNGELRALSYRRQLRSYMSENRSLAWGQYSDFADMLKKLGDELGSISGADPLAERRLLRYLKSLDIDGDASVYRDGGGRTHINIESGNLCLLLRDEEYLEKLSAVVGVRLCQSTEGGEGGSKLSLLEAEPLAVSVGIAALKKRGEKVSGDRGTYFKTEAGVLYVILADGMGCGAEAARDSEQVVSILEKFLRSGMDPAIAMKTLNSVLLLRGGESWGFATVDLMCVNLFSGETCFYKYGAAPSYVRNGKSIKRISGETLAAGLSAGGGIAPDIVRMRLRPGSTAVIATDGVLVDARDDWLKNLLMRSFSDMKALAKAALNESEKLYGANDDMTVVTVRVEERA